MTTNQNQALLVVDVQNLVMDESVRRDETITNIASLVERARAAGAPVVWVRHSSDGDLEPGTPGWQIVDELAPADGEPIVEKTFGDAFAGTDLAERLADLGADAFVLCGAQTDACIRSTFYGGLHRGYDVTVVADAHTTGDLRQWGSPVTPEQSIGLFNLQAANTVLPDARGAVTTTAEAFGA